MSNRAITQTFLDVEKLIIHTARRFWQRYGGDLDELISEANEWFMVAYDSFDPERSSFSHWVSLIVYRGLQQTLKQTTKRASFLGERIEYEPEARHDFNIKMLMIDLSDDAKLVMGLFLKTNIQTKSKLTKALTKLGWSKLRIQIAFDEITKLISGD